MRQSPEATLWWEFPTIVELRQPEFWNPSLRMQKHESSTIVAQSAPFLRFCSFKDWRQSKPRFCKYCARAGGNWLSTRNFTRFEAQRGQSDKQRSQWRREYRRVPKRDNRPGFPQMK